MYFPKAAGARQTDRLTFQRSIEYQMRSLKQNNCVVLVTKHQSLKNMSAFSFISTGYLFIDLSSFAIEKFANALR